MTLFSNISQCIEDIRCFHQFKKDVKRELADPDSVMNKYHLQKNWLGNIVYMQLNCTENDFRNFDYNTDRMVLGKLKPVVDYLGTELGWSEYLVPQISNFEDEEGTTTLSYGVLFIFTPYRMTMTKALMFALTVLAGIGGLITWLCLK